MRRVFSAEPRLHWAGCVGSVRPFPARVGNRWLWPGDTRVDAMGPPRENDAGADLSALVQCRKHDHDMVPLLNSTTEPYWLSGMIVSSRRVVDRPPVCVDFRLGLPRMSVDLSLRICPRILLESL